jgi:L-rhamnose mutarotase
MRIALHAVLRPGEELAYEEAHRAIPEDLRALMRRAGIGEWVIWRSGRHVFHVVEGDDLERALATIAADPLDAAWQRTMDAYVESFEGDPTGIAGVGLRQVWTMSEQDPADAGR